MREILAALLASVLSQVCSLPAVADSAELGQVGQPRADLTPAELDAFNRGRLLFTQKLPNLGPLFNAESCADCHSIPTVGGSGDIEHAPFLGPGPPNRPAFYPKHALPGWTVPARPANASRRIPPPLYGLGLIERIPDSTIRAACGQGHPDPAKMRDALPHNSIARFGIKPILGTTADFVGAALMSESSVTNPMEGPGSKDDDAFPDPEVDTAFVESLAAYVRGLAPPGRHGNDPAGEAVFQSFGCAGCHVPDMLPAKDVFSDFCVHNMGAALADGISDHEAKGDEFRTTPLQGLRFRTIYLHDGRAASLDAAVTAHGGEAQAAASAYQNATAEQRAALLRFLNTL